MHDENSVFILHSTMKSEVETAQFNNLTLMRIELFVPAAAWKLCFHSSFYSQTN